MAHLIIVGASTRAAAQCARRAGYEVWCADLFGDADLRQFAQVRVLTAAEYRNGVLPEIIKKEAPPGPWLFTGGLENQPEVVEAITRERELWGCPAPAIRKVRDPMAWTAHLRAAGLPQARVLESPQGVGSRDAAYMVKPRHGAGGRGVRIWDGQGLPNDPEEYYWQERIPGEAAAALYLAPWNADGPIRFLGLFLQLNGVEAVAAPGTFAYAGSIGPKPLSSAEGQQLLRLGSELARWAGLRGVFGIDGILRGETFVPVEINPRITASAELVERHARQGVLFSAPASFPCLGNGVVGKLILCARQQTVIRRELLELQPSVLGLSTHPWGGWADLPTLGTHIVPGQPILTIFAEAADVVACQAQLLATAERVYQYLERGCCAAE